MFLSRWFPPSSTVDLVPNGSAVDVTFDTRHKFADLVIQYRCGCMLLSLCLFRKCCCLCCCSCSCCCGCLFVCLFYCFTASRYSSNMVHTHTHTDTHRDTMTHTNSHVLTHVCFIASQLHATVNKVHTHTHTGTRLFFGACLCVCVFAVSTRYSANGLNAMRLQTILTTNYCRHFIPPSLTLRTLPYTTCT